MERHVVFGEMIANYRNRERVRERNIVLLNTNTIMQQVDQSGLVD